MIKEINLNKKIYQAFQIAGKEICESYNRSKDRINDHMTTTTTRF